MSASTCTEAPKLASSIRSRGAWTAKIRTDLPKIACEREEVGHSDADDRVDAEQGGTRAVRVERAFAEGNDHRVCFAQDPGEQGSWSGDFSGRMGHLPESSDRRPCLPKQSRCEAACDPSPIWRTPAHSPGPQPGAGDTSWLLRSPARRRWSSGACWPEERVTPGAVRRCWRERLSPGLLRGQVRHNGEARSRANR